MIRLPRDLFSNIFSQPIRLFIFFALLLMIGNGAVLFYSFQKMETRILQEVRSAPDFIDRMNEINYLYGNDLNELRSALGLPVRSYPEIEPPAEPGEKTNIDEERSTQTLPYYRAIEGLLSNVKSTALEKEFLTALQAENIAAVLKKHALVLKKTSNGATLENRGKILFSCMLNAEKSGCELKSAAGKVFLSQGPSLELEKFLDSESILIKELFRKAGEHSEFFRSLLSDPEINDKLNKKKLLFLPLQEADERIQAHLVLKEDRTWPKLSAGVDKKTAEFLIDESRYKTSSEFKAALVKSLDSLDLRTSSEMLVEKTAKNILNLLEDKGFAAYLASKKLTLATEPREDNEYFYYDLKNSSGERTGSFGIQKVHAEVYILDNEDVPIGALKTFGARGAEDIKKKFSVDKSGQERVKFPGPYDSRFSHTFLLVGAHEDMTDTMILATLNEKTDSINMISLPRDLFYRGRKINSIYSVYGGKKFIRDLSELTGMPIENYVIVDMFAFIDVINLLGGIDVTLAEDLVDPTYRVRNGGIWSTLFYPAGTHHLNGIEALRVARSRHFTSDFGRSQRQQVMVSAIKDKIASLGLSDIGKLYDLVKVLIQYVDTDMTPFDIVNILMKAANTRIGSQNVLDTDNILYHSYTNLRYLKLTEEEVDENFDKGAYILLPKEDDWNGFRSFIRVLLGGETT